MTEVRLVLEEGVQAPSYESSGSAGADVRAHVDGPVVIQPGRSALIPTGIRMEIPSGYEIQVRPRSGLALKHGITVLNTPGTIDSDYRGEVGIVLINHSDRDFVVNDGDRIAQLVLAKVEQALFTTAETLGSTTRGSGGFGSTGV